MFSDGLAIRRTRLSRACVMSGMPLSRYVAWVLLEAAALYSMAFPVLAAGLSPSWCSGSPGVFSR